MILLHGLGVGGPLVTGGMGFGFGISEEVPEVPVDYQGSTSSGGGWGGGGSSGRSRTVRTFGREKWAYERKSEGIKAPSEREEFDQYAAIRADDEEVIMLLAKVFTRIIQ